MIMKSNNSKLRAVSLSKILGTLVLLIFSYVFYPIQSINAALANDDTKGRVVLPRSMPAGAVLENDAKGPVNTIYFGGLSALGNQWQVTECYGWSGTWTRRPNTNTFDAFWRHTNGTSASDVIDLKSWNTTTNEVVLYRRNLNGYYKAFYNAGSRSLVNGTASWYPAGQGWSAIIR